MEVEKKNGRGQSWFHGGMTGSEKKKKSDDSLESNERGSHMLRRLQIYESGP